MKNDSGLEHFQYKEYRIYAEVVTRQYDGSVISKRKPAVVRVTVAPGAQDDYVASIIYQELQALIKEEDAHV